MTIRILTTLIVLFSSTIVLSADRYWIAGSTSNWNNTNNWSTASGGAGGASVPGAADVAIFDANGVGNCNVDIAVTLGGMTVNGYTAIIDLSGFAFSITSGNSTLSSGTINDTPGTSSFTIASAGNATYNGTTFGAQVSGSSGRIFLNGSTFNNIASFTKTGANNDNSTGGNTFNMDVTISNTGSGHIRTANTNSDTYLTNVTLNNSGTNLFYFSDNSIGNTVGGNLTIINSATAVGYRIARLTSSDLAVSGNVVINTTGTANNTIYYGSSGDVTVGGTFDYNNTCTAATCNFYLANDINGSAIIDGTTTITNSGTGATTQRCYLGNQGDVTFNGTLDIINNSTANNSQVYCNQAVNSNNTYNQNVTVASTTAGCDGVFFGNNTGTGTLASGRTINIGGGGFVSGTLQLRNFTQTGSTSQALALSGTGVLSMYDSNWGGDVDFAAPRINTRGTTFGGTAELEKTGGIGDDQSPGGNTFVGNAILRNTGTTYFMMGNGTADDFQSNLEVINTGSDEIYIAHNSAGNTIGGDLTLTLGGSGDLIEVADNANSTLTVTGATVITNTSNSITSQVRMGDNGDIDFDSSVDITTTSTGTNSYIYFANGSNSTITVDGPFTFNHSTTATNNTRSYLGSQGDMIFNDVLTINNNATATNSEIYLNHGANSTNQYNHNIIVTETVATGDGIRFGEGAGSGTLAAGRTISVGGGGFVAGQLRLRNFTQVGPTAQSLTFTGTGLIYCYDSNWGGDVTFASPRILTQGTTYNLTASLEKTAGVADDASVGGNTFVGNATLTNAGDMNFVMGNGAADDFQSDLDIINSGTDDFFLAHNSTGNTVGGNLSASLQGSATRIEFCDNTNASLTVTGTASFTNSSNATTNQLIIGDNGDIDFDNSVDITTTSSGDNSYVYFANSANSIVTVDGAFTFNQSTTATNNTRSYIGNSGDMIFNGILTVNNHSPATNNEIYLNHNLTSTNAYNNNIVLTHTTAGGDGIRFGQSAGLGTLAATRTISIGGAGFVAGDLRFRNFTQVGATAQTLSCTGTARIYNLDADWGGDIVFSSPRMITDGTTYRLTASLEKSGGIGDDASPGGNTFIGNATLINSGANYFMMGNGNPDDFQANLDLVNSGTDEIYIAHNSAGNTIGGNLTATMSNAADRIELCDNSNSTLTVTGPASFSNTSNSSVNVILIGENGDIDFDNSLTINNTSSGITNRVTIANGANSAVSIDGAFIFNHLSTATDDTRAYLGNSGDVTFNNTVTVVNATGAGSSHIYCNLNPASNNQYNDNVVLSVTNANSDGIRFGESGGAATLADTRTVTVGAGGYIAGDLTFRNFTQVGGTAQSITCTGTARIFNYDSNWGANVTFIAPRMLTRGTTYNGTTYLEKTGLSSDQSVGGNTFVMDCDLVHTGSNQFLMGNGTADVWQANLEVNTSGNGNMYIANAGAGHSIAGTLNWVHAGSTGDDYLASQTGSTLSVSGNATFLNTSNATSEIYVGNNGTITFDGTVAATNTPSGAINGQIRFSNGGSGLVTFNDNVTLINNGTATTHNIYLGTSGDIDLNGDLTVTNSGSGTTSQVYFANGSTSQVDIAGTTQYTQTGNISNTRGYLGNQGDVTFNGVLNIINQSSSTNSRVYMNYQGNSANTYNGNVTLTSEHAICDGISFGENNGTGSLSDGFTITTGGGGFIAGDLYFRNFTQVGGTAQNIITTGTSRIRNRNALWNGNLVMTGPRFITRESIYNGISSFTKNGASNDDSSGDNTFNADVTFTNSGTGRMRLATSNSFADDFNANATFVKSGSGALQPSYSNADTYAGNISINANAQIYFGNGGNGRVILDGGAGDQDIIDLGASPTPLFRDFQVNKGAGAVNLQMPIEIVVELDLDAGVINTTTTNLLTMRDNTNVSSVSDASHIDGPIDKIGNDAFIFPVGDNSLYRPIEISAPSSGASVFRAQYFNVDPDPTYDDALLDVTLDHISSCEYWTLDRIVNTNNVTVTLSWNTPASCGVDNISDLRVARWDGSLWIDEGNNGTTGNAISGTVTSGAAISSFSPFTLASITSFNPLPIELTTFTVKLNSNIVDLQWETASESDNDYFQIERSVDGVNWEFFATIDGAGTTAIPQSYQIEDRSPYKGENYYRLKQVDFNGVYEYFGPKLVVVPSNNSGNLVVYPNPSNGEFVITANIDELTNLHFYNVMGQEINPAIVISDDKAIIDLSSFVSGVYYLRTPSSVNKLIKQ